MAISAGLDPQTTTTTKKKKSQNRFKSKALNKVLSVETHVKFLAYLAVFLGEELILM